MNPLSLFFKKQLVIEEKIQRLLRYLEDMGHIFKANFESYLDGEFDELNAGKEELDKIEKELDDLGRQIQMLLLKESLMPDSRDDLLWFLTKFDKVPSSFKHSYSEIVIERPDIPNDFHLPLKNLLEHTHEAVRSLARCTDALFSDLRSVRQHVEEVGRQESMVDKIEYKLLNSIFENKEFELSKKYQLKSVLRRLGSITNLAEDVADSVLILSIKYSA